MKGIDPHHTWLELTSSEVDLDQSPSFSRLSSTLLGQLKSFQLLQMRHLQSFLESDVQLAFHVNSSISNCLEVFQLSRDVLLQSFTVS